MNSNCGNCGTSTKDKTRGISLCKHCRPHVTKKRDKMRSIYKEREEAFRNEPMNLDLLADLKMVKRGTLNEALEELTKE